MREEPLPPSVTARLPAAAAICRSGGAGEVRESGVDERGKWELGFFVKGIFIGPTLMGLFIKESPLNN